MLKVPARVKLEEFDEDEGTESCPFRELVGLMGLVISTCPNMSNAVRSVVRDWSTPKAIHWKASLGILACIHQWYLVLALQIREGHQEVCISRLLPTQATPVKQPTGL